MTNQMSLVVWIALIGLSLLWGGSFFFGAVAVQAMPPLLVVWFRVMLAALTLWGILLAMGIQLPSLARTWPLFLFMGFFNNVVPFGLIFWGQTQAPSGLASIFNATTPLFTIAIASVVLVDERFTLLKGLGILAGLIGVALMMGADALVGGQASSLAQLAFLGAACSYGFAIVFSRRLFKGIVSSPIVMATGQCSAAALILLPAILPLVSIQALSAIDASVWLSIASLAVFCTALAYIVYFFIIGRAGATNASLVTFLVPASAIMLGAVFLGERLELSHFVGLALIMLGLALVDGRLFKAF